MARQFVSKRKRHLALVAFEAPFFRVHVHFVTARVRRPEESLWTKPARERAVVEVDFPVFVKGGFLGESLAAFGAGKSLHGRAFVTVGFFPGQRRFFTFPAKRNGSAAEV